MKQDEQESKDTNGGLVYDEYTGHWVDPSDAFNDEDYK